MRESTRFWLAFALSTVGALLLAGLTLDPADATRNLSGWVRMVTPERVNEPPLVLEEGLSGLAIVTAVATMILSFIGGLLASLYLFGRRR